MDSINATRSSLALLVEQASAEQFEANASKWMHQAEAARDWQAIGTLLIRLPPSSSTNPDKLHGRINKVVSALLDAVKEGSDNVALDAIVRIVQENPSRLFKSHAEVRSVLRDYISRNRNVAKAFAYLPYALNPRLRADEMKRTFTELVTLLETNAKARSHGGFRNVAFGLTSYVNGLPLHLKSQLIPLVPEKIFAAIRACCTVNEDYCMCCLELLRTVCTRIGRAGLPWSNRVVDILQTCFDYAEDHKAKVENIRLLAISASRTAIDAFGPGFAVRLFDTFLSRALLAAWNGKERSQASVTEGVRCFRSLIASGTLITLDVRKRSNLIDSFFSVALELIGARDYPYDERIMLVETVSLMLVYLRQGDDLLALSQFWTRKIVLRLKRELWSVDSLPLRNAISLILAQTSTHVKNGNAIQHTGSINPDSFVSRTISNVQFDEMNSEELPGASLAATESGSTNSRSQDEPTTTAQAFDAYFKPHETESQLPDSSLKRARVETIEAYTRSKTISNRRDDDDDDDSDIPEIVG